MRPRSPIEVLVDKACGFNPDREPPPKVILLRCPECKKEKLVLREKTDDPSAGVIEIRCPQCWDKADQPQE